MPPTLPGQDSLNRAFANLEFPRQLPMAQTFRSEQSDQVDIVFRQFGARVIHTAPSQIGILRNHPLIPSKLDSFTFAQRYAKALW